MALVPEDGTGLPTADTYVSLADADAYFAAHGSPSAWTGVADPAQESALRYAARWLDARYRWAGFLKVVGEDAQALAWPRTDAMDSEGRVIPSDEVPQVVKDAQCEAALAHLSSVLNEVRDRGGDIESVTAGPISVSYFGRASAGRTFPFIDALVSGLTGGGGYLLFRG